MKFVNNKKGVTLAELLAVITIMGIIAAIAVPAIGTAIESSREGSYKSDAIAVYEAARVYCTIESCENITELVDGGPLDAYLDGTPGDGQYDVTITNEKPDNAIVGISGAVGTGTEALYPNSSGLAVIQVRSIETP